MNPILIVLLVILPFGTALAGKAGALVWVARTDGALSCGEKAGEPLEAAAKDLAKVGVKVVESRKSRDGKMHIQMCGVLTGSENAFRIRARDARKAEAKGFHRVPAPLEALGG